MENNEIILRMANAYLEIVKAKERDISNELTSLRNEINICSAALAETHKQMQEKNNVTSTIEQ